VPGHDPVPDLFHRNARRSVLDGFDRGPADQSGSLLGDPASMHGLVRLRVLRSQAGPRGQLLHTREPVHIADLGHEHRPEDRPDPGNGLHRGVAGIITEPVRGQLGGLGDVVVEALDQLQQRVQPILQRRR